MRERLNNDPKAQLIFFGIAALVLGFLLMTTVFKGKPEATDTATTDPAVATTDPAATDPAATATDPAAASTATAPAATGTDPAAVPPPTSTAPPASDASGALLPTKGLPSKVLVAYAKNDAIVLLVVDPKGKGTSHLKKAVKGIEDRGEAAVFIVGTKDIADYSRITEGVSVTQAPALVVVRPRKLTGTEPTASVTYGMRSTASVNQAVQDALYKGGQVQPYPAEAKGKGKKK